MAGKRQSTCGDNAPEARPLSAPSRRMDTRTVIRLMHEVKRLKIDEFSFDGLFIRCSRHNDAPAAPPAEEPEDPDAPTPDVTRMTETERLLWSADDDS